MKHPYAVFLVCTAAALTLAGCSGTRPAGPILCQTCARCVCHTDDPPTDAPCASVVATDDLGLFGQSRDIPPVQERRDSGQLIALHSLRRSHLLLEFCPLDTLSHEHFAF